MILNILNLYLKLILQTQPYNLGLKLGPKYDPQMSNKIIHITLHLALASIYSLT
jgi:hypothetical protein